MPQHRLGDFEIGDHAVFHRPNGDDIARGASQHAFGFLAHRQHIGGAGLDGHDGRFAEHDALVSDIHERIGRAQVDSDIVGKQAFKLRKHERCLTIPPHVTRRSAPHGQVNCACNSPPLAPALVPGGRAGLNTGGRENPDHLAAGRQWAISWPSCCDQMRSCGTGPNGLLVGKLRIGPCGDPCGGHRTFYRPRISPCRDIISLSWRKDSSSVMSIFLGRVPNSASRRFSV